MDSLLKKMVELEENGDHFALCTIIQSQGSTPRHVGSKMIVFPDGKIIGSVGGGETEKRVINSAMNAMELGTPKLLHYELVDPSEGDPGVCGGQIDVFIEPMVAKPNILIIGAGHVGKAVSFLAKWLGFKVIMSDDRPELCTLENNPHADEFCISPPQEVTKKLDISSNTYVIFTTRSLDLDVAALPSILSSPTPYIGVIGSRRRWELAREALFQSGISKEKINEIKSPIGLDIKAETPEEIAVSIMGEIIHTRNNIIKA
jgi:xanthine dehydrogenase accessory factor